MSIVHGIELAPVTGHHANDIEASDTKKDPYEPNVLDIDDAEKGDTTGGHDIIPPGVDPDLVRREQVHRGLKQRHIQVGLMMYTRLILQMIALAGAIGTGLFLGSGRSIRRAGPVGTLIGYSAVGFLVICVMGCIGETSALAPVSGAYIRHAELFVDPALSFAIGWSTFYGSAVSVPAEWTAVAVLMSYWSDLSPAIWISICIGMSERPELCRPLTRSHHIRYQSLLHTHLWRSGTRLRFPQDRSDPRTDSLRTDL
jgi:hypothetical protein